VITWYSKNNLTICFDVVPDADIRFVLPEMSDEQIKDINDYPFILNNDLECNINYKNVLYKFEIKAEFTWDGATIPRFAWFLVGSKTDNHFLIASFIHDVLCKNHKYVSYNRCLSTKIFCALLEVAKVNPIIIFLMFQVVDNYQKLCWLE